jgi:outer membrane protein assembly factor BamB
VPGQAPLVPGEDGSLSCRDAATGKLQWTFATRNPLRASPAVDEAGGRVMLGAADRRFLALGLDDGKEKWTWKIGAQVQGNPAVLGDRVLFATHEDVLYALKRGSGSLVWQATLPSRPLSAPLTVNGAVLVACYGTRPKESFVVGFDVRTGRRLGDLKTTAELATPPIVLGDALVAGLRDRSVVRLALARPEAPEAVDKPPGGLPD